ncbi:hypothetical protein [Nonomuraea basaltis]|uniref:hypothetical protein n=1 Tax=Nonomuraea basaltis TaxID=2495887 RepID=UPI00110C661D|nr:hypothetical protein [Nonomuraea basaltis]TMR97717.1 hypothetical protein EJK15_16920 [Nonomuraea basaltis]
MVQRFDAPVAADQCGELGVGDPPWWEAGDGVDGDDGGLPVRWSVRRRLTWIAWAACGKGSPGRTVQIFMRRISRRPCPSSSVRSLRIASRQGSALSRLSRVGWSDSGALWLPSE